MLNLWYKNAVIYCVDVDAFRDGNGDGIGDFRGLADSLDHIEALGATCIWLNPFYPSPNRDNGYDITDYYGVDPRYGTLGNFVEFMAAARDHGMRVIIDLVVNHTSTEHPWFQAARDPKSPFHDWYIWSDTKPKDADEGVIFPGVQKSTWTYDRKSGKYYFHRFYEHQADLNLNNPAVREEIDRIMGFWLELGVSGFRIDAVPFLIEGLRGEPGQGFLPEGYLSHMNRFLGWRRAEAILLAEANIPYDKAAAYFDDGDRMHLVFNFVLNQKLFLALTRGEAAPVAEALHQLPDVGEIAQWATFLRNHDEIDLGRLSDAEREEVFAAMGPDKGMQIYDRGIRRRLAPMLGGDERRLKNAFSLLMALPGTPVIWYGDEIGMGDNLALEERDAVRCPMQWTPDGPTGGFSTAAPEDCIRHPVTDPGYDARAKNVEDQHFQHDSLLETVQRLVRLRRSAPEIGWGKIEVVDVRTPGVVALVSRWQDRAMLSLHNLSAKPATARVAAALLEDAKPVLASADGGTELEPYGFRWWRLARSVARNDQG